MKEYGAMALKQCYNMHVMHLSRVVPTHPTSGDSKSQGGALVRPVEVFCCCQPLGWCSPPVGVGICTKAVPEKWGKVFSKVTISTPDLGRPRWGRWDDN